MFCPKCGKELEESARFCPGCGQALPSETEQTPPIEDSAQTPSTTPEVALEATSEAPTPGNPSPNPVGITNPVQNVPYTTVPYTPGYELSTDQPTKKKPNKKVVLAVLAGVAVLAVVIGVFSYFTGDGYRYKKGVDAYNAGDYDTAYPIFYSLGDYKDAESFLPFHGKYVKSPTSSSTITFKSNGTYEYVFKNDDGDSVYKGTYTVDGYEKVYLKEDDGDTSEYSAYQNYIYRTDDKTLIFDKKIDFDGTPFNDTLRAESEAYLSEYKETLCLEQVYTFENDGTYVKKTRFYAKSLGIDLDTSTSSGTYKVEGQLLFLTANDPDDNGDTLFVDADGTVYISVFEKQ